MPEAGPRNWAFCDGGVMTSAGVVGICCSSFRFVPDAARVKPNGIFHIRTLRIVGISLLRHGAIGVD